MYLDLNRNLTEAQVALRERAQGSTPESLGFHTKFAVTTSLVTVAALVVLLSLAF